MKHIDINCGYSPYSSLNVAHFFRCNDLEKVKGDEHMGWLMDRYKYNKEGNILYLNSSDIINMIHYKHMEVRSFHSESMLILGRIDDDEWYLSRSFMRELDDKVWRIREEVISLLARGLEGGSLIEKYIERISHSPYLSTFQAEHLVRWLEREHRSILETVVNEVNGLFTEENSKMIHIWFLQNRS